MHSVGITWSTGRPLLFITFSCQLMIDILGITLPIFALSLSASPFEIGLLATSRALVYSLFTFVMGYVSDRVDRRQLLAYSMLIDGVASVLLYFSRTAFDLIVLGFFQGLAMAIFWPTMEALIVSDQDSGITKSLRNFNVSWGMGVIVGPLIGGGLITLFGVKSPFLVVLAIAVMNEILVLRYAPRRSTRHEIIELPSLDRPPIKLVSTTVLVGALGTIFLAFFPAFGVQRGISAFEIGVMLFFFGITRALLFFRMPSINVGLQTSVALASLGLFLVYIGDRVTMYLGTIVSAAATTLLFAYSLEKFLRGEEATRGRRAGIFEGSAGIGAILGSFFAGLIAQSSLSYAFLAASLIGLAFLAAIRIEKFALQTPSKGIGA